MDGQPVLLFLTLLKAGSTLLWQKQLTVLFPAAHLFAAAVKPDGFRGLSFVSTLIFAFIIIIGWREALKMHKKWFGSIIALAVIAMMVGIMLKNTADDGLSGQKKQLERELAQSEDVQTEVWADDEVQEGIAKGEAAPDFTLTTLDGGELKLSDLRGEKVILNFWASWCGPCRAEMPHMQDFHDQEAEEAGVQVIAVNLSTSERGDKDKVMENIQSFVDEFGLTFPIPLDMDGEQMDAYRVITIPTTYIIDTSGIIRHVVQGPMDEEMMRDLTANID